MKKNIKISELKDVRSTLIGVQSLSKKTNLSTRTIHQIEKGANVQLDKIRTYLKVLNSLSGDIIYNCLLSE